MSDGPVGLAFNASSPVIYVNGSYVVVTCTADCNPTCDIQWERDGEVESNDGVLTIADIQLEQEGLYSCIATNTRNGNLESEDLEIVVVTSCKYSEKGQYCWVYHLNDGCYYN